MLLEIVKFIYCKENTMYYNSQLVAKLVFEGRREMISDFIDAAFPWILIGLFLAFSISIMSEKEK